MVYQSVLCGWPKTDGVVDMSTKVQSQPASAFALHLASNAACKRESPRAKLALKSLSILQRSSEQARPASINQYGTFLTTDSPILMS